ncbi:MAG: hypothetical protein JWN94_4355 [Betaproteobacteria bacterium]|nr:hypothetical protein [Betaproteobacteria bacterium]
MKSRSTHFSKRQRGAVLVVSLIMLAVLTLFVISMLKTAVIELKIGGSSQTAAVNRIAAESGINNFLALNSGRFAPGWLSALGISGPVVGSFAYSSAVSAYGALGTSVAIAAYQVKCGPSKQIGQQKGAQALQSVQFDIVSTATGGAGTGGVVIVHQGIQSLAPPGPC